MDPPRRRPRQRARGADRDRHRERSGVRRRRRALEPRVADVILTGLTTDNCVLFTASDAYLRDFNVIVPRECVAALGLEWSHLALRHMARVLNADVQPSTELDLAALGGRSQAA